MKNRVDGEMRAKGSPDDYFCSEFVSYAWRAGGLDLSPSQPDYFTTPDDLAQSPMLQQKGALVAD